MSKMAGGITLIVIGAILTFAWNINIPGLGEHALGIILLLAGVLLVGLALAMDKQRRRGRTVVEERPVEDRSVVEERPVVEERRRRTI